MGISVAHASPGRVRLRAAGIDCAPALDAIAQKLRQLEGVCEVGKNQGTGSLTVTFDSKALPLPELLGAIEGWGAAPATALAAKANQTDPFAAWKSAEFWKKQGRSFLPVIAGLLAARGLGLVGWRALLAYMIAANTTRQLFDQLDIATPATAPGPQTGAPPKLAKIPEQILATTAVGEIGNSENFSPSLPPHPSPQEERGGVRELNGKFSFFGAAPAPAAVAPAAIAFSIAHAIRGRLRFHVPRIAADPQYARRLQKLAESAAGVTLVRVNSTAASIAISYDPRAVSDAEMRCHLAELIQEASTPIAPGHTATPPPPPPPEASGETGLATGEPVESQLAVSEAEIETEEATESPPALPPAVSEASIETEVAESEPALSADSMEVEVAESEPALSADSMEVEMALSEQALSADSMEVEVATDSRRASEPAVAEEVNFWFCLWQTVRSTMQGLRAGLPPANALISGLKDAGAIS
jgi:cation transport ATPase